MSAPASTGAPDDAVATTRPRRLRGRPAFYVAYAQSQALWNTPAKRGAFLVALALALAAPFLLVDSLLGILARGLALAIGAIGLNIITGYAGQVSLGHAFFIAIGAYTAATLGGPTDPRFGPSGLGLDLWVWIPAAGLAAAAVGFIVSPLATRLRGLYLAIVTLGLVFLGSHIFREWRAIGGAPGQGRLGPRFYLGGVDLAGPGDVLGVSLTRDQRTYLIVLVILVLLAIVARNIARSDVGRAFQAVRDRDLAAKAIGVNLARTKALAFTISSFYAGVCGALFHALLGNIEAGQFSLLLSVQFVAMVLIGGVATVTGAIAGAMFIAMLPFITRELIEGLPFVSGAATTIARAEGILYGLLIVGFLLFEPRGLFGIWMRIRNYWKGWPFSY